MGLLRSHQLADVGEGSQTMTDRVRPYQYYDATTSICATCHDRVDAKVVFEGGRVLLHKRCPEHGAERVLIADDVDYYLRARNDFLKPSEMPVRFNTPVRFGCPYDCGLCADHEQHSCLTLVEICDACNLSCPVCYASSGPHRPEFRSVEHVERMLDLVCDNEGEPDVVQISGGEPTEHPELIRILKLAKERPIRHLMLNTNGVRIARDKQLCDELADLAPGFEIYLQFDSLCEEPQRNLRGADLLETKLAALDSLRERNISTTLVVTLKRGLNDSECGELIEFALQQPHVRGITFQPIQDAGRNEDFDAGRDRLTLTEVRRNILEQSDLFTPDDLIPVPCHPDALCMAYALKLANEAIPLTRHIDAEVLKSGGRNTIAFERDDALRERVFDLFSTAHSPDSATTSLKDLLCCIPRAEVPRGLGYENLFRVIILEFLDAHSFDVRSVRKSCVHIVHPDAKRIIPFDTYNLFYRDELERTRLAALRAKREPRPS